MNPLKKLLSKGTSNAKTVKNSLKTFILYLSPFNLNSAGINICPKASNGCAVACLNTAGRAGIFPMIGEARKRKTDFYINDRQAFCEMLLKELKNLSKRGEKIAVRLNGTSDLDFHAIIKNRTGFDILTLPNLIYYDYTKIIGKALKYSGTKNYTITFSRSEVNETECATALQNGINVATVFSKKLPAQYLGAKVLDGDKRDDLMLSQRGKGVIIGLRAKGKARKDNSGFVIASI